MRSLTDAGPSAALAIVGAVVVIAAVGPTVSAQPSAEPAVIVSLEADGSAVLSVRSTFDLTTAAEREAFQSLEVDATAQATATDRFMDRLRAVAADAENATGREMRVRDPTIELWRTADNETGVITLSATWEGLASVSGESLTVGEPFASGFETDRRFVLTVPDGYTIVRVSPEPDAAGDRRASWNAGTDLDGFEVVLEPAPTPSPEPTASGGQPGFGPLAALLGLLGAIGVWAVRRGRV